MKEEALKEKLEARFAGVRADVKRQQRVVAFLPLDSVSTVLMWLKDEGYHQLTLITCVDWIEEGQFELVYHVASHADGIHVMLKARVDRENPVALSITSLYENAQPYEREIHEFFGVDFTGNGNLTPLYLDNWDDIPPMRRDFDTLAYSERKYDYE
ncbi:MAG TPA: NADH-quinone oxidoreductase subunit C [Candidatus Acetothermia bacterium]|nr:NADH-quinone oxidoreductase subunit C [Candidatus Acetothermia bacterium]